LSNLNFLFEQQTQFAPNQARILDGQVSVFRRPGSRNWQCRFKLPSGQWHVASTGNELLDQARQQAIAIHALVQARIEQGKVCVSVKYGSWTIELAKGKPSVEVANGAELVKTLETIKGAVEAGELDAQIETASASLRSGFKR
jgi:hypothetical protein